MEKQIHLKKVNELFAKSPVVDFSSIERIIRRKSKKSNYAKLLVLNLLKSGKIKRIGKGFYSRLNDISLAVFYFKPAYMGLQSALSYYGFWEQETIPIILTSKTARTGLRKILGKNILIKKLSKKYFFGVDYVKEGDIYLPYSDIEKTFIDMVVFNQKMDLRMIRAIKKRIDRKKLDSYLKKYPKNIRERVIKKLE